MRKKSKPTDPELLKSIREYADDILRSKNFMGSSKNIQHGNISVMRHSMKVACASLWMCRKFKIKCSEKELVRGALLHDYFLYDWHDDDHRALWHLHGFFHPGVALKNAMKEYRLSKREQDIIKKHMWPMTVIPPRYKESWIVTCADKYVSTLESLRLQQRHVNLKSKDK